MDAVCCLMHQDEANILLSLYLSNVKSEDISLLQEFTEIHMRILLQSFLLEIYQYKDYYGRLYSKICPFYAEFHGK